MPRMWVYRAHNDIIWIFFGEDFDTFLKLVKIVQKELSLFQNVLEREEFLFVLDRACLEFDADDPDYHRVTQATYDAVNEKQAFGTLRFTRHFGPFVFYLVQTKNIDDLLLENLKTER